MSVQAAVRELKQALGELWVLHRPEDLLVYEYDGTIERSLPQAVVLPETTEQVAAAVRIARRHGLPVTARGSGTGLSGGAIACEGGLVIVTTRMNRILSIDPENATAVVQPGVINLHVSEAAAPHGLYYAPDPSSQKACSIGGNIAENAGGPHTVRYGSTVNHILALEFVTADGSIVRTGEGVGYDLTGVVVGSEGTLCIVTEATLRLLPKPEAVATLLVIFDHVREASEAVSAIVSSGILPSALEMMDARTMWAVERAVHAGYPPDAGAVLLIEVEGLREETDEQANTVRGLCDAKGAREVRVGLSPAERESLWVGRKAALGALGRLAPSYYILDGVVPRTRLPDVLDGVYAACERYDMPVANVFHAGDGNLHPNLMFDESIPGATERVLELGEEILRLCVDAGGSITGEHGVGFEKRDFMALTFSDADMEVMAGLKRAFGADDWFNPGKIFPTSKGCGEVSSRMKGALAKVGPGAYI